MKKLNKKQGISLIVLVITIIVMIILAAAIILSLQSSGIIGRANEASTKSDEANMLQAANVAYGEYLLERNFGETNEEAEEYIIKKLGDKFSQEELNNLNILSDGTIQILPTIPTGFVVSQIEGENKISEGLVVYEIPAETTIEWTATSEGDSSILDVQEKYNQYVWIPVDDMSEFEVKDWGYGITGDDFKDNISEPYESGYTTEVEEYNKMKVSVEKNGGFYIARYEAGLPEGRTTSTVGIDDKPVSKKGANVWNKIPWGTDVTTIGTNGAVYYSKSIYKETDNSNVVSTLCYGVQWDAVMNFMKDVVNVKDASKKYIEDSTDMGWYSNNFSSGNLNHNTGKDLNVDTNSDGIADLFATNKVKNIYDMAGNVWDWTMEADSTDERVLRGGVFGGGGTNMRTSVCSWPQRSSLC